MHNKSAMAIRDVITFCTVANRRRKKVISFGNRESVMRDCEVIDDS